MEGQTSAANGATPGWAIALVATLVTLVVALGIMALVYSVSANRNVCSARYPYNYPYTGQLADVAASSSTAAVEQEKPANAAAAAAAAATKNRASAEKVAPSASAVGPEQRAGSPLGSEQYTLTAGVISGEVSKNGIEYAPHSDLIPPAQRATLGVDQPHLENHPIEQRARQAFEEVKAGHPDTQCYETQQSSYDPAQSLLSEAESMVPLYQQRLKELPAMNRVHLQQESAATNIGPNVRQGIDTHSQRFMDKDTQDGSDAFEDRVRQTAGANAGIAGIYGRGDTKGISMINKKSTMVDPTKMLPRAQPGQESNRMVQAGPSIADIGCRVPKAADIMRMMRSGSSVLSNTIPRDKPPVYTEGLNAFRKTRLPAQTSQGTLAIGMTPYEISDIVDFPGSNPFLHGSSAAITAPSYYVP